jgi:hypothetical protein
MPIQMPAEILHLEISNNTVACQEENQCLWTKVVQHSTLSALDLVAAPRLLIFDVQINEDTAPPTGCICGRENLTNSWLIPQEQYRYYWSISISACN